MRSALRLIAPAAIGLIILTGCDRLKPGAQPSPTALPDNGVAALSADEILAKAKAALDGAKSYRLKGDVTTDEGKLTMDVKFRGADLAGKFTMSGGSGPHGTAEAIRIGSDIYFKGDGEFWRSIAGSKDDATAQLLDGKWVKPPNSDKFFAALLKLTDTDTLLKPEGTATKGEVKKLGDIDVITLKDGESSLYVATRGEPYPVRVEGPPGQGQIDLSEFGAAFDEIKAPPADQVVDMSKLAR
jgi:hypothetical protein